MENKKNYTKTDFLNFWGDNGYIKIAKGEKYNSGSGQCGILLSASYPIL